MWLFTDGSIGKDKNGAYAYIILDNEKNIVYSRSKKIENTTINRMELKAVLFGIRRMKKLFPNEKFFVYTDSKYVEEGINKYLQNWKKNGYKRYDGKQILNFDLWKRMERALKNDKICKVKWVKAHQDRNTEKWRGQFNNYVDKLAVNCRIKK